MVFSIPAARLGGNPVCVCGVCGLRYDRSAWMVLEYVGRKLSSSPEGISIETRRCQCGTTCAAVTR